MANTIPAVPDTSRQGLLQMIEGSRADAARIKLVYQLCYFNIYKAAGTAPDSLNTLPWLIEGIRLSNTLRSLTWELEFTRLTGEYYLNHLDYLNGENYFKKAINISIKLKDKNTEATLWKTLADQIGYTADIDHLIPAECDH